MRRLKGQGGRISGRCGEAKKVSGYDLFRDEDEDFYKNTDWGRGSGGVRPALEVFDRYPISELIIHPRTAKEFYTGTVHWEIYRFAREKSSLPLCYNGDLFTLEEYEAWDYAFPKSRAVMFGRGVLGDPLLLSRIRRTKGKTATWEDLQYELYVAYQKEIGNEQHVLSRLKEFWTYRALCHPEEREKIRQIYRTETLQEYAKRLHF